MCACLSRFYFISVKIICQKEHKKSSNVDGGAARANSPLLTLPSAPSEWGNMGSLPSPASVFCASSPFPTPPAELHPESEHRALKEWESRARVGAICRWVASLSFHFFYSSLVACLPRDLTINTDCERVCVFCFSYELLHNNGSLFDN